MADSNGPRWIRRERRALDRRLRGVQPIADFARALVRRLTTGRWSP